MLLTALYQFITSYSEKISSKEMDSSRHWKIYYVRRSYKEIPSQCHSCQTDEQRSRGTNWTFNKKGYWPFPNLQTCQHVTKVSEKLLNYCLIPTITTNITFFLFHIISYRFLLSIQKLINQVLGEGRGVF